MDTPGLFHHQQYDLKLHRPAHIEQFARHLFQNDKIGLQKVDKIFKPLPSQRLLPPKPRDYAFHHIPQ